MSIFRHRRRPAHVESAGGQSKVKRWRYMLGDNFMRRTLNCRYSEEVMGQEEREALEAIAEALDCDRNKMGNLVPTLAQVEKLQGLAIKYDVGACDDVAEQAFRVARAVLEE